MPPWWRPRRERARPRARRDRRAIDDGQRSLSTENNESPPGLCQARAPRGAGLTRRAIPLNSPTSPATCRSSLTAFSTSRPSRSRPVWWWAFAQNAANTPGPGGGGSGGVIDLAAAALTLEAAALLQARRGRGGGISTLPVYHPDSDSGAHGGLGQEPEPVHAPASGTRAWWTRPPNFKGYQIELTSTRPAPAAPRAAGGPRRGEPARARGEPRRTRPAPRHGVPSSLARLRRRGSEGSRWPLPRSRHAAGLHRTPAPSHGQGAVRSRARRPRETKG